MTKAIHNELAPKEGERASPDGFAIRSNKAWRELASEALTERDSARAANIELGMTYANHLCAFHIGDSAGMTLMGSPFASARDLAKFANEASAKGDAEAIRYFVGAAIRLHSEAMTALNDSRIATESLHAANATIAELREDIADAPSSIDMAAERLRVAEANKARDAAQARCNNAENIVKRKDAELDAINRRYNAMFAELESVKAALGVLTRFVESA